LKIGHSQSGTLIVCPKCKNNTGVPFQSHPQAEALYQFIKRKKAELEVAESAKKQPLLLHRARRAATGTTPSYENLDLYLKEAIRTTQEKSGNVPAPSAPQTLEESTEHWIEEFWKDNTWKPDNEANAAVKKPEYQGVKTAAASVEQPVLPTKELLDEEDAAVMIVRQRLQIKSLKILSVTMLLLGLSFGYCLSVLMTKKETANVPEVKVSAAGNALLGTVRYKNANGEMMPDTDAAVFFLPVETRPLSPVNAASLCPGEQKNDECVQQIEELGGKFFQCDASGSFTFEYKPNRRYYALFISAHAPRQDNVSKAAVSKLQQFFTDPNALLGKYLFILEEYEWQEGRYILPVNL
jgi:hypothetical protein